MRRKRSSLGTIALAFIILATIAKINDVIQAMQRENRRVVITVMVTTTSVYSLSTPAQIVPTSTPRPTLTFNTPLTKTAAYVNQKNNIQHALQARMTEMSGKTLGTVGVIPQSGSLYFYGDPPTYHDTPPTSQDHP